MVYLALKYACEVFIKVAISLKGVNNMVQREAMWHWGRRSALNARRGYTAGAAHTQV